KGNILDIVLTSTPEAISKINVAPIAFNYTPWLKGPLNHQLKCSHSLRRRFKTNPSPALEQKLIKEEETFAINYSNAKCSYERQLVTDSQPHLSHVFQYIRTMTNSDGLPHTLFSESQSATSSFDKAELFNKYFFSVFTQRTSVSTFNYDTPPPNCDHVSSICCEEDEVYRVLSSLDGSKALGIDGIGPLYLKKCAVALTPPITHLFNLSLSSHSLPLEWRTHLIKPIFKSGDKCSVTNYRPISLLPVISKVLERIILNKISDHI
uniref:Reverse transcriptase domain-containing protein n=1 Tax=Amphimedon queenslandica TaxID=400682 RepID=A0A1X7TVM9_AMPQE